MARKAVAPDPDIVDPEQSDVDENDAFERELEQAALGDIALLDDVRFENVRWSVWRFRTDVEMRGDPNGERTEYVGTMYGPIDSAEFRGQFGGGTFDVRGYVTRIDRDGNKRGLVQKYRPRITIAAPRRNFADVPKPDLPPPVNATTEPATDRLLRLLVKQQMKSEERFERLLQTMAQARAEPPPTIQIPKQPGLNELVAALVGLKQLSGEGNNSQNAVEVAKMILDGFHQGVVMGQEREPISADGKSDPNNFVPLVEKGLEILSKVMSQRRPMRGGPGPRPAASPPPTPPPTQSEATVIETEAPAATHPQHRWMTAVEAMYRAMSTHRDPRDFASSLEDILNEDEAKALRSVTADEAIAYLKPMLAQYPSLETDQGKVYLASVLAALRELATEANEDAEPTG